MALNEALTAEEQSQLTEMQNADRAAPATETTKTATATATESATLTNTTVEEPKTVPVAEVIRQRERRQATEKQLADERAERAKLQGRLETLEQLARQVGQPTEAQIPDVTQDPVGHFRALTERQQKEIAELRGFQQQTTQQTQQQREFGQIIARAAAQENEFRRENADYDEASVFMRDFRDRQLQAFGIVDPAIRAEQVRQDAEQIVRMAQQNGGNVAKIIYDLAKASGYQTKAKTNGTGAPSVDAPQPTADELKVTLAAKGQKQGGSIGQVRGGAAPAPPSLETLANMSDDEFAEMTKGNKWKKLLTSQGA